jgi:hypothetical protein
MTNTSHLVAEDCLNSLKVRLTLLPNHRCRSHTGRSLPAAMVRIQHNALCLLQEYAGELGLQYLGDKALLFDFIARRPRTLKEVVISPQRYGSHPIASSLKLGSWYWANPQKSNADFQTIAAILDTFIVRDLVGVKRGKVKHELDSSSPSALFETLAARMSVRWWLGSHLVGRMSSRFFSINPVFYKSTKTLVRSAFSFNFRYAPY